MKYYVYELWNPLKNEPFYVGKGSRNRPREHLSEAKYAKQGEKHNWHKINTIRKILREDKEVEIKEVFCTDIEQEALDKEKQLIAQYGRADKKEGLLTNLTDGGESISGLTREKFKQRNKTRMDNRKKWSKERENLFKKRVTISVNEYWDNFTDEEKKEYMKPAHDWRTNLSNNERISFNKKQGDQLKSYWSSLSDEEKKQLNRKQWLSNANKSPEEKRKISEKKSNGMKTVWANMSPEKKQLRIQKKLLTEWSNKLERAFLKIKGEFSA